VSPADPGYGRIDRDYAARLAGDDRPVWMVNLMRYKPVATYPDGDSSAGGPVSGREADDRYAPVEILADIGAEITFVGDVEDQLLGTGDPWDRVAVVRYPSGRAFIDMQARDDFRARHVHKEAGMAATFVIGCRPATGDLQAPVVDDLPDWSTVPHPPTDEDGPVMVLHVTRYAEAGGREAMRRYQEAAALAAVPHGVRIGGWFDVDGTIVGDGRQWDQVRFNRFPSKAAFFAVVRDPARLEAQAAHREPALADTYTLVIRPTVDRLDGVA
jgi:hypothetical protein